MKLASIAGHVLELCALIEASPKPVDQITWTFFKERKYLGARDRYHIRETLYGMQRHWRLIDTLAASYFQSFPLQTEPPEGKERFLPIYIAHERIVCRFPVEEMIAGLTELWEKNYSTVVFPNFILWLDGHAEEIQHPDDEVGRLGIQYSFPDWMVKKFLAQYAGRTESLLASLNSTPRVTLRVNRLKITREECRQRLQTEGIETTFTQASPVGLIAKKRYNRMASPAYKEGLYEFQDEGSQLISLLADPKPGMTVIDACAGGGGKTLHLAEIMDGTGTIVALDIDMERMNGLEVRKNRSNISNIELRLIDAVSEEMLTGKADVVLVDAPCSGVGRIRRSPGTKRTLREKQVDSYPEKQGEILRRNATFVKPGGRLIYATCSLFSSENEDVVNKFLNDKTGFKLIQPADHLREFSLETGNDKYIRILPNKYPTDGFFVAVMEREL